MTKLLKNIYIFLESLSQVEQFDVSFMQIGSCWKFEPPGVDFW